MVNKTFAPVVHRHPTRARVTLGGIRRMESHSPVDGTNGQVRNCERKTMADYLYAAVHSLESAIETLANSLKPRSL